MPIQFIATIIIHKYRYYPVLGHKTHSSTNDSRPKKRLDNFLDVRTSRLIRVLPSIHATTESVVLIVRNHRYRYELILC